MTTQKVKKMEEQKTLSWCEQLKILNQNVQIARRNLLTAKSDITIRHPVVDLFWGENTKTGKKEKGCININNTVCHSTRSENATFVEYCDLFKKGCTDTKCSMYPKYQVYVANRDVRDEAIRVRRKFWKYSILGLYR